MTHVVTCFECVFLQDDLLAELEELEQEGLDEKLLEVSGPATDNLPSVPVSEPAASAKSEYHIWPVMKITPSLLFHRIMPSFIPLCSRDIQSSLFVSDPSPLLKSKFLNCYVSNEKTLHSL